MTDEIISSEILTKFDQCSLLEKVVGKRQSIIFALLLAALIFAYWGFSELASVILGFVGIVVKGYIDDASKERAA